MIARSDPISLTPEEYLQLEEKSPIKHEYIDGEVMVKFTRSWEPPTPIIPLP
jgi:Uma2 family endonuclease